MAEERILTLSDDDFDERIQKIEGPVVVDFWAAWCAPCKIIAPLLEEIAGELDGKVTVAKINIDDNGDVVHKFGIRSIPTLIVFKGGKVVDQVIGALPKQEIRRLIDKHLA